VAEEARLVKMARRISGELAEISEKEKAVTRKLATTTQLGFSPESNHAQDVKVRFRAKEYKKMSRFADNYDPVGEKMVDELKRSGEEASDECIPPMAMVDGKCVSNPSTDPVPPAIAHLCKSNPRGFECRRHKMRQRERRGKYNRSIRRSGYTPYQWEASQHLRNAAVATKVTAD
jgi:hypothetical protein